MSDVKEGFLCPICVTDLGDLIQLQASLIDEFVSVEESSALS
jgi:uncharacterized protein CbrC (UPF0167 family)